MADRPARRGDLGFSAALFVLALLPRLYVAIAWAREPVWDGHYYDFGARRIAAGLGYSDDTVTAQGTIWHPWCHYPVGYSGFLGAVYRVFGAGAYTGTIANAVMGALTAVVVHRLARYAMGLWRARVAGALVAVAPGLIAYTAVLMTEPLAGFLLVASAWLLVRERDRRPLWGALLAGAVMGLATLVRPQSLACAPFLALLVASPRGADLGGNLLFRARVGAVALGAALLVVAPWTARNCRVMDGCALVSTNGGWNLAIGSFPRATGRFETLRATDGCPVVTGQVQQDRCWMDEGLRWIRQDPARWLSLVPKKLGFTFDHESFPIGYLAEADPRAWPEERRAFYRDVLSFAHRLLLSIAALGVVARPGRSSGLLGSIVQIAAAAGMLALAYAGFSDDFHPFWPLAVALPLLAALPLPGAPARGGPIAYAAFLVASVVVTHAVFFGEDRYHVALTPVLCLLAAGALRRSRREEPLKPLARSR